MEKTKLKNLLESLVKEILNEELVNLERLQAGVSRSTTILGKHWTNMIQSLEGVYDDVKDFHDLYVTAKQPPSVEVIKNVQTKLDQVIKLLEEIRPVIVQLDKIQREDLYNEGKE